MITNPRVFDDCHLPRELMHREGAVETLLRAWEPTRAGDTGDEVIVSGPSGVGKTVLVRHTLDRLTTHDVASAYVRCLGATPSSILSACLDQHSGSSTADDAGPETLRNALANIVDEPFIVVLDEADGLANSSALDHLASVPNLSTVVICHDPRRWLARLTTETVSERYISATQVELDRYGVSELADILEARARVGLPPNVVDRDQLEWIADEAAGVARYGIQSLRAAAEHASDQGRRTISDADVAASFERAQRYIRRTNLQSLTFHHHVLYGLIHTADGIRSGELHERYDAIAERIYEETTLTPIVRRTRRNRLRKLREYDLVEIEGPDNAPVYHVVDEAIEPPVPVTSLLKS